MFKFNYEGATIIAAPTTEIKSIYKSICRAGYLKSGISPLYSDFPIFRAGKIYGICIDKGFMTIINEVDLLIIAASAMKK